MRLMKIALFLSRGWTNVSAGSEGGQKKDAKKWRQWHQENNICLHKKFSCPTLHKIKMIFKMYGFRKFHEYANWIQSLNRSVSEFTLYVVEGFWVIEIPLHHWIIIMQYIFAQNCVVFVILCFVFVFRALSSLSCVCVCVLFLFSVLYLISLTILWAVPATKRKQDLPCDWWPGRLFDNLIFKIVFDSTKSTRICRVWPKRKDSNVVGKEDPDWSLSSSLLLSLSFSLFLSLSIQV